MFLLEPPPGFRGLDPDKELTIYRRHLPHWRQSGATYFVTFRLADSLPQSKLTELKQIRAEWTRQRFSGREPATDNESIKQNKAEWEALSRKLIERTEMWLDQGMGSCVLKQQALRQLVTDALQEFDGKRYELGAYVAMPNHVHAILRPFDKAGHSLESVLQGRKRWTSRQINKALNQTGPLWQQESYDRIIRDPEHLWKCIQYSGANPQMAGITEDQSTRWIRPEWEPLGWAFTEP